MSKKKICRKGKNHFEVTKCAGFSFPFLMHKSELNEQKLTNVVLRRNKENIKQFLIKQSLDNLSRQV